MWFLLIIYCRLYVGVSTEVEAVVVLVILVIVVPCRLYYSIIYHRGMI